MSVELTLRPVAAGDRQQWQELMLA